MTKLDGLEVAVVGGAVGGAAAALLLARAGARVKLFERIPAFRAVGAGIALQPNGLGVLYGLGLEAALVESGRILSAPRIADGHGRTLLEPRMPPDPAGFEHILMIRRSDLAEVLRVALERQRGVTVTLGADVRSVTPSGRLVATVDGSMHEGTYDLVVGADGVHSRVRDGGSFGATVEPSGISYVRGLGDRDALDEEAWTAAGIFGSFPLKKGTYWYCSTGRADLRAAIDARDLDALRSIWRSAYPRSADVLVGTKSFDELLVNEVVRVDCSTFVDERLVLVGDAAHAMAPNLGQGANSALVDAAVLVDELERTGSVDAALASYDRRRRPAVRWVQDAAASSGRISEATGPIVRWIRDRVLMPLAAGSAPKRMRRAMQEAPVLLREIAMRHAQ